VLDVTDDGPVRTITIDRPGARNALDLAMRQQLERECAAAASDDSVRVVVLAAVDPVFCGGADTREIAEHGAGMPPTNPGAALRSIGKPTICAVNGACVTGGLELALSCDLIVASERARFADTHVKLGVLPRWGMSALLPRRVGLAAAIEISGTGRFVEADEALRLGLVSRVVPHDTLAATVAGIAAAFAAVDQRALRAMLELYRAGADLGLSEALALEHEAGSTFVADLSRFGGGAGR
jgi:enoyl-CoA hydratase